jgi:hypothetical protein
MAKDRITIHLELEADFKTIQAIRRTLSPEPERQTLALLVARQTQMRLAALDLGPFALTPLIQVSRYRETTKGAYPTPSLQDGQLTLWDYDLHRKIDTISIDTPYWLDWLQQPTTSSFRYQAGNASFTAIKETRRNRPVWYAHKRLQGTLKRLYLGKTENLTAHKLADTARKFSQLRASVSPISETTSA